MNRFERELYFENNTEKHKKENFRRKLKKNYFHDWCNYKTSSDNENRFNGS